MTMPRFMFSYIPACLTVRRGFAFQQEAVMAVTDTSFNPSGDEAVTNIKEAALALASEIEKLPASCRRTVALTNLETASMWAVKAAVCGDE